MDLLKLLPILLILSVATVHAEDDVIEAPFSLGEDVPAEETADAPELAPELIPDLSADLPEISSEGPEETAPTPELENGATQEGQAEVDTRPDPDMESDSTLSEAPLPLPTPPESEVEEETTDEASLPPTPGTLETRRKYKLTLPLHQQVNPIWGIEFAGSYQALKGSTAGTSALNIHAANVQFEFQPPWIQKFGVLGIGPSVSLYPEASGTQLGESLLAIWSAGGIVRYQAKYFREQPVVPMGGFLMEYWNYRFSDGSKGAFLATGPVVGLWVLLNFFDQDAASSFYLDYGVARTYLVAEARFISGSDSTLNLTGNSYYAGLRFEL